MCHNVNSAVSQNKDNDLLFFYSDVSEEHKTLFKRFTESFAFTQHVDRDFLPHNGKKYCDSA